jgi:hypothetical protein
MKDNNVDYLIHEHLDQCGADASYADKCYEAISDEMDFDNDKAKRALFNNRWRALTTAAQDVKDGRTSRIQPSLNGFYAAQVIRFKADVKGGYLTVLWEHAFIWQFEGYVDMLATTAQGAQASYANALSALEILKERSGGDMMAKCNDFVDVDIAANA